MVLRDEDEKKHPPIKDRRTLEKSTHVAAMRITVIGLT